MNWREEGNSQTIGCAMIFVAFAAGFGLYQDSDGVFNVGIAWLFLMFLAILGTWVIGHDTRRDLKAARKAAMDDWLEDAIDHDTLEGCSRRRDRRAAIRGGEIDDDGLTDFARAHTGHSESVALDREIENLTGINLTREDVFAREKEDSKIEAAWERKVKADAAWQQIRPKRRS